MGGGGKQPTETTSTSKVTQTNLPEYLRPYITDVSSRAQAESRTPYQAFGGQRIEGINADQQAAMGDIRGMETPGQFGQASNMYGAQGNLGYGAATQGLGGAGIAQGMGMGQAALGAMGGFGATGQLAEQGSAATTQGMQQAFGYTPQTFGAAQAQQYTNPFQQQVTDVALRKAREEATRQGNLANLSAAGRGTAGGTRQAVMDSMRNRDLSTQLSDVQMKGSMQGFENAQQQFERDQKRQMGAASLGAQMAGQGFGAMGQAGQQYGALSGQGYNAMGQANNLLGQAGMQGMAQGAAGLGKMGQAQEASDFARYQAQMGIGDKQQAYNDRQLQTDYADFLRQRDYGKENLNFYSGILRGLPNTMGSTAISYGAQPNVLGQLGGLGIAAYGGMSGKGTR
tara:strand:+ start:369 stop:1562 length:1194 start_codon:yes stop_codon:yes gene_type:complete